MDPVERTNWLAHRWPIKLETFVYGQTTIHTGRIEGLRVGQAASRAEYDRWFSRVRPVCLARLIADRPIAHPAVALVVAGEYRLGRIPPELWCGYDAMELLDLPSVSLLSAKARAMFPEWPGAIVRVVREDRVGQLGLRPAREARGPRLRIVA